MINLKSLGDLNGRAVYILRSPFLLRSQSLALSLLPRSRSFLLSLSPTFYFTANILHLLPSQHQLLGQEGAWISRAWKSLHLIPTISYARRQHGLWPEESLRLCAVQHCKHRRCDHLSYPYLAASLENNCDSTVVWYGHGCGGCLYVIRSPCPGATCHRADHWIVEVIGLAARAVSHHDVASTGPYIIQVLLILLAPIIFSAAVYMFLGRLIRASGYPQLSFIRINWLTKLFVCGDIICFLIQGSGAGKLVNAHKSSEITSAQNTVLGGLGLQVFFFCIFLLCAIVFHKRVSKPHVARNLDPSLRLSMTLYSLYFCSVLIIIRNIYRLIEYKTGQSGYLQMNEWPAYVFDIALMAILMMVSLFWYLANTKARTSETLPLDDCHSEA